MSLEDRGVVIDRTTSSAAVAAETSTSNVHVDGIEWARIAGCIAIVAFHLHLPGKQIFLGGLHVFTAIMVALSVRSARRQSVVAFASSRLRTLGVPWLFWCVVYAGVAYLAGRSPLAWTSGAGLLVGPKIHLWFLPFAIIVGTVLAPIVQQLRGPSAWLLWCALVAPAMVATATTSRMHLDAPFDQWLSTLPSVVLGLGLADLPSDPSRRLTFLLAGWWSLFCGALATHGYADAFVPLLVGGLATLAAWSLPSVGGRNVMPWSRLTLGVYLVHPLVMRLTHRVAASSVWLHLAVVVLLSFGVTWVLKRSPVISRFV